MQLLDRGRRKGKKKKTSFHNRTLKPKKLRLSINNGKIKTGIQICSNILFFLLFSFFFPTNKTSPLRKLGYNASPNLVHDRVYERNERGVLENDFNEVFNITFGFLCLKRNCQIMFNHASTSMGCFFEVIKLVTEPM